jgi:hypothetical protein
MKPTNKQPTVKCIYEDGYDGLYLYPADDKDPYPFDLIEIPMSLYARVKKVEAEYRKLRNCLEKLAKTQHHAPEIPNPVIEQISCVPRKKRILRKTPDGSFDTLFEE